MTPFGEILLSISLNAAGIVPSALEMMDHLALEAVEASVHAGYPTDADAVLLIEIDGLRDGLTEIAAAIEAICAQHNAREVRQARSDAERNRLWAGRKGAFGAMGRISPDYYVMDGVVPRSGMSSPNDLAPADRAVRTKVPEPARRSTRPAACNSRTARPTVIRDVPNDRTSSASLGSRSPCLRRPDWMSRRRLENTCWYFGVWTSLVLSMRKMI
jgi:FAD/FMN-containing dehydrogenase